MKLLSRTALVFYLLILLWLILFKFSLDISGVLDRHATSLNLVPLAGSGHLREVIENFIVFIPFGLLLGVNFKRVVFWRKVACVFAFSVVVETIQFALAIGVADITDVIANTLGGLVGLVLYGLGNKYVDEKQDKWIVALCILLLVAILFLRFFVLRVKY